MFNKEIQKLFHHYSTQDFEFVLRLVWRAHQINSILGVEDNKVKEAYSLIRESLIKTVQQVHVDYSQAVEYLPSIAGFLRNFKNILSLNYDLLIYWAMLHGNNTLEGTWFKDGFIDENRSFKDNFHFLRHPIGQMTGATLVFYPHGNLVLATDVLGQETKICNEQNPDLLESIVERWNFGDSTPLFVSEGSSEQKLKAIHRHGYLRTVYNNVLNNLGDRCSVCIYGWSMSNQDFHLLEAIGLNKPQRLAVSVYTGSEDWPEFCERVRLQIKKVKFGFKSCDLLFFDSQSDECWIRNSPIS